MRKLRFTALAFFSLVLPAAAATVTLNLNLTTDQQVPPPQLGAGGEPEGWADLIIDTDSQAISGTLIWTSLTSPMMGLHIHRRPVDQETGPRVHILLHGPAGQGDMQTVFPHPLDDPAGFFAGLQEGTLYLSMITRVNPSGEIRANIPATALPQDPVVIPEPGTSVLFALGVLSLPVLRRYGSKRPF